MPKQGQLVDDFIDESRKKISILNLDSYKMNSLTLWHMLFFFMLECILDCQFCSWSWTLFFWPSFRRLATGTSGLFIAYVSCIHSLYNTCTFYHMSPISWFPAWLVAFFKTPLLIVFFILCLKILWITSTNQFLTRLSALSVLAILLRLFLHQRAVGLLKLRRYWTVCSNVGGSYRRPPPLSRLGTGTGLSLHGCAMCGAA